MSSSSPSVRPQDSCAKLLYFGSGCAVPEVQLPAGSRSVCRHRGGAPSLPAAPSFTCDESGIMPKYDGHFTSLSVHGQETCQSKMPPWLVNPAHHLPQGPSMHAASPAAAATAKYTVSRALSPPSSSSSYSTVWGRNTVASNHHQIQTYCAVISEYHQEKT